MSGRGRDGSRLSGGAIGVVANAQGQDACPTRRRFIRFAATFCVGGSGACRWSIATAASGDADSASGTRFHDAAAAMRRLAESWGDQPYGAVVVLDDRVVGEGPSRVIQRNDPAAHAEREAIRDAQRRLGREDLSGAVLYSTSRPCVACEAAAANAKIARMIHGTGLVDAGPPFVR
jgi:tRNA(adenine34) deaminase